MSTATPRLAVPRARLAVLAALVAVTLAVTLVLLTTGSATSRSTPNAQAPVSTTIRPDESDVAIAVSGPAPRTSSHPDEAAVAASLRR